MGSQITKLWDTNLSPAQDLGQDLGSASYRWKDLYVGGVIYGPITTNGTVTLSGTNTINGYQTSIIKGSGTLTVGTTTTVTIAGVTASSIIMIQPTGSAITSLGVYVSAKNSGNFVLTHLTAAGGESFDYIVIN